eukprot:symbB.v1.2.034033.t2/scaffold4320.1/size63662/6
MRPSLVALISIWQEHRCAPASPASATSTPRSRSTPLFRTQIPKTRCGHHAILEAEATGEMKSEVPERLGHCAADLWNEFVAAAKACGGVPETWASIARNLLANDYAFALFSVAEAKIVQQQLSKLQIQSIIDPMAGTGLHGRLLADEGLRVQCADAMPGGAGEVFEALPAISAAAAAAAFDAAGLSPDVLQNLLQEQQRDTVPEAIATPSTKPSGNSIPLVISVADALAPAKPRDTRTTVMLRNLPNNYTRLMVVNLLNQEISFLQNMRRFPEGFKGKFDFLYLPIDFRSKAGLGYAFVNLCDPSYVQQFWKTFDGFTKWVLPSSKVCQVSWSGPHQGQAAHVERYRSSPIMHSSVPDECKPIVLLDGERVDFPEALKKIRAPRQRK